MPWYVMLCAGIYALDTLWQGAIAGEIGTLGLLTLPSIVAKIAVMFVALAYWDSDFCVIVGHGKVMGEILLLGTLSILVEGFVFAKIALMRPERSVEDDNGMILDTLLRRVVVPGVVLFFAMRLYFRGGCAS